MPILLRKIGARRRKSRAGMRLGARGAPHFVAAHAACTVEPEDCAALLFGKTEKRGALRAPAAAGGACARKAQNHHTRSCTRTCRLR